MIYTEGTKKALWASYHYHHGQVDKAFMPYVFHPVAVAESMETETETIVALLHDVIEDSWATSETLLKDGFSSEVVEAVEYLTRPNGYTYDQYIREVKTNPIARKVKIADLKHNMDLSRLNKVTDADIKRVEKYRKALEFLSN